MPPLSGRVRAMVPDASYTQSHAHLDGSSLPGSPYPLGLLESEADSLRGLEIHNRGDGNLGTRESGTCPPRSRLPSDSSINLTHLDARTNPQAGRPEDATKQALFPLRMLSTFCRSMGVKHPPQKSCTLFAYKGRRHTGSAETVIETQPETRVGRGTIHVARDRGKAETPTPSLVPTVEHSKLSHPSPEEHRSLRPTRQAQAAHQSPAGSPQPTLPTFPRNEKVREMIMNLSTRQPPADHMLAASRSKQPVPEPPAILDPIITTVRTRKPLSEPPLQGPSTLTSTPTTAGSNTYTTVRPALTHKPLPVIPVVESSCCSSPPMGIFAFSNLQCAKSTPASSLTRPQGAHTSSSELVMESHRMGRHCIITLEPSPTDISHLIPKAMPKAQVCNLLRFCQS